MENYITILRVNRFSLTAKEGVTFEETRGNIRASKLLPSLKKETALLTLNRNIEISVFEDYASIAVFGPTADFIARVKDVFEGFATLEEGEEVSPEEAKDGEDGGAVYTGHFSNDGNDEENARYFLTEYGHFSPEVIGQVFEAILTAPFSRFFAERRLYYSALSELAETFAKGGTPIF